MVRVEEFMDKAEQPVDVPFEDRLFNFRMKLIAEEFKEMAEAASSLTLSDIDSDEERTIQKEKFIKEVCDCMYVLKGMAVTFGWDLEEAFNRVHQSNMTKIPFSVTDDGKVQKGENYEPPNLEGIV
jgi:predicted HAD superfamily Cof-like phosphohydrolase|tara:strand:+ start:226 stop:603 length:378 start_codon:yes stop_codon:yes gene_type:complete